MCTKEFLNTGLYDEKLKIFKFSLYNNICEVGLLYILGFTSSHNESKFPRQWSRLRNENLILKGINKDVLHKPVRSDNSHPSPSDGEISDNFSDSFNYS